MRAVRYHEFGPANVMQLEEIERPRPGAGQVVIEVAAGTFNPIDAAIRAGFMRDVVPVALPHTPGIDVAGTVAEVGADVTNLAVGEPVIAFLPMTEDGSAAEYVRAPADAVVTAPTVVSLADAAALPVGALTAWQALFEDGDLRAGQRILINGGGGGVGGFAIQLARRAGATVLATASPRSTEAVTRARADQVIDYTAIAVSEAVDEPVDVVLNLARVTGEAATALVGIIRPGGIIVSTTASLQGDPGRGVRSTMTQLRIDADRLASLVAMVDAGELALDVTARFPLADIAGVHERGMAGRFHGKVLLLPDSSLT